MHGLKFNIYCSLKELSKSVKKKLLEKLLYRAETPK